MKRSSRDQSRIAKTTRSNAPRKLSLSGVSNSAVSPVAGRPFERERRLLGAFTARARGEPERVVVRALAPRAEERFQDGALLAQALSREGEAARSPGRRLALLASGASVATARSPRRRGRSSSIRGLPGPGRPAGGRGRRRTTTARPLPTSAGPSSSTVECALPPTSRCSRRP